MLCCRRRGFRKRDSWRCKASRKHDSGQRLLINGAGGGAGTLAVQIARSIGAHVTGVDSAGKLDMLRALGVDHCIDYEREDFTRNERRYDVIFDVKTNRSVFDYLGSLAPNGRYVTVGSLPRVFPIVISMNT